ncbi:TraB/GumN family protein [Halorussus halophilus]|uniref:hypothetical protein n=1 Tax=Halorussus halophilus TaxID=2650975 RepID=UPI0013017236|nr:hypothetical protein [Halorussus halophilus]
MARERDPRLREEYVHTESGLASDVTLVGVVHDHPASVYRTQKIVRERDPEVVALEAPPLAVPLYETYARNSSSETPAFGGEMSAAACAAAEAEANVVGIDAPTGAFLARLARNCWDERASTTTVRRVLSGVGSVTRHALVCRMAAAVATRTGLRVEVDSPVKHDCDSTDSPDVQARDERKQAEQTQSLLRAFDTPEPIRLRDDTREQHMATRLASLRERGPVVAVVGLDHLDGITARLCEK